MEKIMRGGLFLLVILFSTDLWGAKPHESRKISNDLQSKELIYTITPPKVNRLVRKFVVDTYNLWDNFFDRVSLKVFAGVLPFYLIGRKLDPDLHQHFYDADRHKNIHQPPKVMKDLLSDGAMAIPFGIYGVYNWFNKDPYKRRQAQVFTVGLFWTWTTKVFLKEIKVESGLRPWHEEFSRHERTHGGNPSGHTSMATFMATYVWMVKGGKYGYPLAIYAGLVGGLSVAVNHHYVSQVVAGAGLGIMLGVSASSVFEKATLPENMEIGLATDRRGGLGVQVAYNF